jgi:hypothetical protein
MATVISGNQVKLDNGKIVSAQTGGWYDGQQFWGGTLSDPGVINPQSNQPGAGQAVSQEVVAQTNPANVQYLAGRNPNLPYATPTTGAIATPTAPGVAGAGTAGATVPATPTINLSQKYSDLYATSGISDLETQLNDYTTKYTEALAKINDNPFLSEATRVGRVRKIEELYQDRVANIQNQIASKKTDIQNQLSIAEKQYQYETEAQRNAAEQAASASKKNTQTIQSTDDSGNVTVTVINSDTGEVISQKSLGQVEKATKTAAAKSTSGGLTATQKSAIVSTARQALTDVDTNQDQGISAQEYIDAVRAVMTKKGISEDEADNYVSQALSDLGYWRWQW